GFAYPYKNVTTSTGTDSASFTSTGASVFWYANTATPITISNAYVYQGTPLTTLPAGASVTPLLTDASGSALSLIYTLGDGRQYLTQTFDSSPYPTHDLILAYGLINWVTKGLFLGEYHVYAAAQVDDFFINGSEWVPGTPCTDPITHDRTPPDATTLRFFRINSADMTSLVAWQNRFQTDPLLSNFKLTLAFNGVGTTGNIDWTGLPTAGVANDDLTTNVQKYQQYFHWISHTYDHPNSLNGLHKSDPYGDPDTPQVDSIDLEILTNKYVANGTGQNLDPDSSNSVSPIHLTDFNPANLVTPGVTGLNDTSVPSYLVQPPYNSFTAPQILDYVSSSFVTNMLMGDIDPEMFHQPNLHDYDGQGHSLLGDTYDQTFTKYERIYKLPVVSPTLDQLGQNMQNRNTYNLSMATASLTGLSGSNLTISITVPATASVPSAIIPITGLYTVGAESYGGQQISHVPVSRGQTITLPVTPAPPISLYSLTLNPTSVTGGGPQPSIGTVTLSGLAPAGGTQVSLSSSSALASIPPSVVVPAESTTATFTVNTSAVATSTVITISASYGGASKSASLTVTPPTVASLTLNPTSVVGGVQSSTGTVTLSGPAPAGGAQVTLSSGNGAANVPAIVTVPAGSSSATFTVNTSIVLVSTSATISASYNGTTQTASLAVLL